MDLQELTQLVREAQGTKTWDTAALIRVGGLLAAKVNAIQNLKGQEKKTLVCSVLKTVLTDMEKKELSDESKGTKEEVEARFAKLRAAVDDVVPASLDLAVLAARGQLDLKKIKPSMWVRICGCFTRTVVTALASQNLITEAQAKQATDILVKAEEKATSALGVEEVKVEEVKVQTDAPVEKQASRRKSIRAAIQELKAEDAPSAV